MSRRVSFIAAGCLSILLLQLSSWALENTANPHAPSHASPGRGILGLPNDVWHVTRTGVGAGVNVLHRGVDASKDAISNVSTVWIIGVTCASLASFLSTFGVNLQKYSHQQNDRLPKAQQIPYWRQFLWFAGLILLISGTIADMVALAFVAQSLIAPLGSITLIANTMVAPCFLGEVLTNKDIIGTVVTAIGCSLSVAFANHSETSYAFRELMYFFFNPGYLIFFIVAMGYLYGANKHIQRIETSEESIAEMKKTRVRPFLYASIGGTAGAFSVTFAKAFVELIKATIQSHNEFLTPGPYVVIIFLVGFSLMQVHYLNKGLQMFDALFIVPIYQTFWIVGNVFGGIMYYQEYRDFSLTDAIMFPLGISITLGGMGILATQSKDRKSYDFIAPEDEANITDEERLRLNSDLEEYVDEYADQPTLTANYTSPQAQNDGQFHDASVKEDL